MHIDWWTLALQAINILILVWLLSRFLYRPVMKVIAERQLAADTLLSDAQVAKDAALAETAALKAQNDDLTAHAARRRAEMQAEIENDRVRLLAQAQIAADAVKKQAAAVAEAERARLMAEWQDKACLLAGKMAETLLRRLPASRTTAAMFDALVERLDSLSEEERRKLADDSPLAIHTPSSIGAPDQARYLKALNGLLPGAPVWEFAVDPTLIAGFEVRGAHIRIRNSWRTDLDGMLAALKESDNARLA
ncbi:MULTISPECIES: F0F1 ATP synthase subunit B [Sphingobium]|uniref:F0F1 ATP synthase subunit B family protein n=1 Tax=Sphingobium TaxID=165695 RepID=UPI000C07E02F|nr:MULTISPECIES: F0F1 ATP synthase subunit B [Sphingobium]PHP21597.1 hypothetical protein CG471_01090 [Sphingobium sp. IP1]